MSPDSPASVVGSTGARRCAVALVAAVLVFAAWQYATPPGFASVRGLNPGAVSAWRAWLGLSPAPFAVSLPIYVLTFRVTLIAGLVAYAGLWWMVWRCDVAVVFTRRWTWPVAIPLVVALAILQPASLSTDVYAYVGYARLAVVHGLNPYLHTQAELVSLGDPTAAFLHWPIASPYGPLWTLISMGVVSLSPVGAVMAPVVALKLLAGGGLLVAAAAARAVVRRGAPARSDAVFVLVALNPLLLIEGPGNGHNDLIMVALLLLGFAALPRGRGRWSAVFVGLSTAVKLVPLIVVPWVVVLALRAARARWPDRVITLLLTLVLAVAPVVAAYAPFWSGTRTLSGVGERMRWGQQSFDAAAVTNTATLPYARPAESHAADQISEKYRSFDTARAPAAARPVSGAAISLGRIALRGWPALLICVWASLAACLGRGDAGPRLATVWCAVALGVMLFLSGLWFPWYLAWVWPPLVVRFTRPHLALTAFVLPFSLLLMLAYAMPPG